MQGMPRWELSGVRRLVLLSGSLLYGDDIHDWLLPLNEQEMSNLSDFNRGRYEQQKDIMLPVKQTPLSDLFPAGANCTQRNQAIYMAFQEGYRQGEIARFLNLSAAAVSRIISAERKKRELFNALRDSGLFWSYAPDIQYDAEKSTLLVETALKYADIAEIRAVIALFGVRTVHKVWNTCLKNDSRFKRLNYFLARVFFNLDVEADDFAEVENIRGEKLRLLAG